MKLIDKLKQLGLPVPEKKPLNALRNLQAEGWNACHDQWASIEVPKISNQDELEKEIGKVIKHYKLVGSKYPLEAHIAFTICSLQPTVKVPSVLEIEKIIDHCIIQPEYGEERPSKYVAKAIRAYLEGGKE